MKKILGLLTVAALLAACDDRGVDDEPITGGSGGDDGGVVTPTPTDGATASLGDVTTGRFEDGVLTVQVALDGEDAIQEYGTSVGDVNGYSRFDQQETPLNRAFSAIAGTSSSENELVAVVTMDGGQFNRFFGGGVLNQNAFSAPDSGFSYFQGDYAGFVNVGSALPPGGGAPGAVTPSSVGEVTGSVYLIADFTDNATEGTIYGRQADVGGGFVDLDDLVLINTSINADGTFAGAIELEDLTAAGDYSGAFGGDDATYVGGIVSLGDSAYDGVFPEDADTSNLREYGLFIIGQCDPASCFAAP